MKKLISIIFILLFLSTTAYAKVVYNNSVMQKTHIHTIKGLLYEVEHFDKEGDKETKDMRQEYAKAIAWLADCHKTSKIYKLESLQNKEALLIKHLVSIINDVVKGKYPGIPIEDAMVRWTNLGERVSTLYEIKTKQWKLKLNPEKPKTKNLVFQYETTITRFNKD